MAGDDGASLGSMNPHLVCGLCDGYLVDATTITECLHSFCRSCILKRLYQTPQCPLCGVPVHKTRPHLNLRSDTLLQEMVYKLVPGLYRREVERRKRFYMEQNINSDGEPSTSNGACSQNGSSSSSSMSDLSQIVGGLEQHAIHDRQDPVSLSLQHCLSIPDFLLAEHSRQKRRRKNVDSYGDKRYLQCPAGVTISHLKKFLRLKFDLSEHHLVELFYHSQECLRDDYTLADVAYITKWPMEAPLELFYMVCDRRHMHLWLTEIEDQQHVPTKRVRRGSSHPKKKSPVERREPLVDQVPQTTIEETVSTANVTMIDSDQKPDSNIPVPYEQPAIKVNDIPEAVPSTIILPAIDMPVNSPGRPPGKKRGRKPKKSKYRNRRPRVTIRIGKSPEVITCGGSSTPEMDDDGLPSCDEKVPEEPIEKECVKQMDIEEVVEEHVPATSMVTDEKMEVSVETDQMDTFRCEFSPSPSQEDTVPSLPATCGVDSGVDTACSPLSSSSRLSGSMCGEGRKDSLDASEDSGVFSHDSLNDTSVTMQESERPLAHSSPGPITTSATIPALTITISTPVSTKEMSPSVDMASSTQETTQKTDEDKIIEQEKIEIPVKSSLGLKVPVRLPVDRSVPDDDVTCRRPTSDVVVTGTQPHHVTPTDQSPKSKTFCDNVNNNSSERHMRDKQTKLNIDECKVPSVNESSLNAERSPVAGLKLKSTEFKHKCESLSKHLSKIEKAQQAKTISVLSNTDTKEESILLANVRDKPESLSLKTTKGDHVFREVASTASECDKTPEKQLPVHSRDQPATSTEKGVLKASDSTKDKGSKSVTVSNPATNRTLAGKSVQCERKGPGGSTAAMHSPKMRSPVVHSPLVIEGKHSMHKPLCTSTPDAGKESHLSKDRRSTGALCHGRGSPMLHGQHPCVSHCEGHSHVSPTRISYPGDIRSPADVCSMRSPTPSQRTPQPTSNQRKTSDTRCKASSGVPRGRPRGSGARSARPTPATMHYDQNGSKATSVAAAAAAAASSRMLPHNSFYAHQYHMYPHGFYAGLHPSLNPAAMYGAHGGAGAGAVVPHPALSPGRPVTSLSPLSPTGCASPGSYFYPPYPQFYRNGASPPTPTPTPSVNNGYDAPLELTTKRSTASSSVTPSVPRARTSLASSTSRTDNRTSESKTKETERTLLKVPSLVRP